MTLEITRPFPPGDQRQAILEWLAEFLPACEKSAKTLRVSPVAVAAQAALESGWARLRVGRFNLFGIKATPAWDGKRVLIPTREWDTAAQSYVNVTDWFCDFDSYEEAIAYHLSFLQQNSRYRSAGVFDGRGDAHYFAALKRAGYATDPEYVSKLMTTRDLILRTYIPRLRLDMPVETFTALSIGSMGADVGRLQGKLGVDTDGIFGPLTDAAVRDFQEANGLPISGVVDNDTWRRIMT